MTFAQRVPFLLLPAIAVLAACGERHAGGSAEPAAPPAASVSTAPDATAAPAASASTNGRTNQAIERVLGEHAAYQATFQAFQQAVQNGDARRAAAQVRFPLRVGGGDGSATLVADADAFVRDYARIVTPDIARVVGEQDYDTLLVNQQGVAFDDGVVWIGGRCEDSGCARQDVKVVTIQSGPTR